jgi:signal transduction histidine kinase
MDNPFETTTLSKLGLNRFFSALTDETCKRFVDQTVYEVHPGGTSLFEENDPADAVYLLLTGEVELTKKSGGNKHEVLARVMPGDYFGELGVLDQTGRSTGARTVGQTKLAKIPAEPFLEIIRSEPAEVSLTFLGRVLEYLRNSNKRFMDEVLRREKIHLLGDMADSIVHDFKGPITGIHLAAELISSAHKDENTARWCKIIRQQSEQMLAMTEELLDYARGCPQLNRKKIAISELFGEFEFMNADYFEQACVEFSMNAVDATVDIDPVRFPRVLQNLVSNAIDAMGIKGGKIRLESSIDGRRVEIRVIDNGPGIPEHIHSTIFEPFVTAGKRKGIGLGMAITKAIVEAHAGTIHFETEAGKGTAFIIRIPVATA